MTIPGRDKASSLIIFGAQVRRFRTAAGLSQDQTGAKAHISGSFIGKVERGEARCDRRLARKMGEIFGVGDALEGLWVDLGLEYSFPTWFADWPKIEAEATNLDSYQCLVVDGLLQIEDYALGVLGGDREATAARISRQSVLTRQNPSPPRLSVLLAETVLHNQIGSKATMRAQLEHLLDSPTSQESIQVVPAPIHSQGLGGAFAIASLAGRSEIAYVETAAQGFIVSEPEVINRLWNAHRGIRSRALPVDMSRDLIRKVLEDRWT